MARGAGGGARAAWDLAEVWDNEVQLWVQPYAGGRGEKGTVIENELMKWEQPGWPQVNEWRTFAKMFTGKEYINTGLVYNLEVFQEDGSEKRRRCGPGMNLSDICSIGCVRDKPDGTAAPGPHQWAYKGASIGPSNVPVGDDGCWMSPEGSPADPGCSGCSYALSLGIAFSVFKANPGIVRQWEQCLSPNAHSCEKENPQCGARFEVLLEGHSVWDSIVHSSLEVALDISSAKNITLVTGEYLLPYW